MTNVGLSSCRIHVKDDARYYADSFNWFALGFQQWGYTGEQSNKITFALSYPKAVLGILVTTGDGIPQNPVDVTLSGATAVGYNSAGCKTYWLAYGIQQWGYHERGSSKTITYPLAMTTTLSIALASVNNGSAMLSIKELSVDGEKFALWYHNENQYNLAVRWIAIGR